MAVRNFWIEAEIDGRRTILKGGPRNKGGGMHVTLYVRENGNIETGLTVRCLADDDGNLRIVADSPLAEGSIEVKTHRDKPRGPKLTELEQKLIDASRNTDYGDAAESGVWSFAVIDKSGVPVEQARGALASLVKKGLAGIHDHEGKGNPDDMVFELSEAGIAASRK